MPRPRQWDPPFQDDRDEILMIDSGQDPVATREALVMARRALSLLHQDNPRQYDTYAAPLQKLIDQLPNAKKSREDYLREQNEAAKRAKEAAEESRRTYERSQYYRGDRGPSSRYGEYI